MAQTPSSKHKSPWHIDQAKLHWDNGTPCSNEFDDLYFSKEDALGEVDYVFLQGNDLEARFQEESLNSQSQSKREFIIAETGFGTGLNFLCTLRLWLKSPLSKHKQLHFISFEKYPLNLDDLIQAHKHWPELEALAKTLQQNYPKLIKGIHQRDIHLKSTLPVKLSLIFDDIENGFDSLQTSSHPFKYLQENNAVDAWFLDGFAPSKNEAMWSDTVFKKMAALSHRNTTLATFTAAGFVKRGLQTAGFRVSKTKGFGRKRERIIAQFQGLPYLLTDTQTTNRYRKHGDFWHIQANQSNQSQTTQNIAIIGAGIAGLTLAHQLSQQGMVVSIFDKNKDAMQEASGNPQAVLFPKLSAHKSIFSEFNLTSLLYAINYYTQLDSHAKDQDLPPCFMQKGLIQSLLINPKEQGAKAEKEKAQATELSEALPDLIKLLSAQECEAIAGTQLKYDGLYYSELGHILTHRLKTILLASKNIKFYPNSEVTAIKESACERGHFILEYNDQKASFDQVVIANAASAKNILNNLSYDNFSDTDNDKDIVKEIDRKNKEDKFDDEIAIKNIRGQISAFPAISLKTGKNTLDTPPQIKTTICHHGYINPPFEENDTYSFGASFDLHNTSQEICETSHQNNLTHLKDFLPEFEQYLSHSKPTIRGRVNFRCTTTDYMPIIGPVHRPQATKELFNAYEKNAKAHIPQSAPIIKGLWLNIAYGSRGFATAPYCASLLASAMLNTFTAAPEHIIQALHPARFTIKKIKQNHAN